MLFQLKYIHDGIVQLSEHHKVDRKAGSAVLGGRVAREPGQGVVLLQNKPVRENTQVRTGVMTKEGRLAASGPTPILGAEASVSLPSAITQGLPQADLHGLFQ